MQLKQFLTENVVTIGTDASIDEAVHLLNQHHVRHLPVARDGQPVGMVSLGDVLVHVGGLMSDQRASTRDASVKFAGPTQIEQIMSPQVVSLSPEDSAAEACRLMLDRDIAAVILVSEGKICGIVTEADLLGRFFEGNSPLPEDCRSRAVAELMTTELITATKTESAFSLIRKMAKRIHHVPITEDGKLLGMVSEHDVRRALALDKIQTIKEAAQEVRLMGDFDAGKIMSHSVETTTPDASLADAARQMVEQKVGSLPVIKDEKLIGIITETDLLQACAATLESC